MSRASGAVFFDRDGVLNEVVVRDGRPASPRRLEELVLAADAPDAVDRLRDAGFSIFVITNQPDVARGLLARALHDQLMARVAAHVRADALLACTHDDTDGCDCRKPRPGMLLRLAQERSVDLARSYVVGDTWKDVAAGAAAGCTTVLLRRPYNQGTRADLEAGSLTDAVNMILEREATAN